MKIYNNKPKVYKTEYKKGKNVRRKKSHRNKMPSQGNK